MTDRTEKAIIALRMSSSADEGTKSTDSNPALMWTTLMIGLGGRGEDMHQQLNSVGL